MSGNTNRILFLNRCSFVHIGSSSVTTTHLLRLKRVAASPITFTRLCIYLLFSDCKENKKSQPDILQHIPIPILTCPVVPLKSPLYITNRCPLTSPKVQWSCLPAGCIKQMLLQLQKVEAASDKCTFRAGSPVSVCLLVQRLLCRASCE